DSEPPNAESSDSVSSDSESEDEEVDVAPVTPPKSGSSGMVTLGCYFKVQQSRYRKRP
ncbi:hypothetical protein Tco_0677212, partial [Tanacetum coccineum]